MNLLLETLDWSSGCLYTALIFVAVLCCAALMILLCHLAWSFVDWLVEWNDRRWWARRKRERSHIKPYPYSLQSQHGAGPKLTLDQINAQCRENAAKRREWMTEFANQWPPYTHCSRCDWFGTGPCPNCNRVVPIIYKRQIPENETRKDL